MGYTLEEMKSRIKLELGTGPITSSMVFDTNLAKIIEDAAHDVYLAAEWSIRWDVSASSNPSNLSKVITAFDPSDRTRVIVVTTSGPEFSKYKPDAEGKTTAILVTGKGIEENGTGTSIKVVYLKSDANITPQTWPGEITRVWYLTALADAARLAGNMEKAKFADGQAGAALERAIRRYDVYYNQFSQSVIGEEIYSFTGNVTAAVIAARVHAALVGKDAKISRSELTNIATNTKVQAWIARPWPFAIELLTGKVSGDNLDNNAAGHYAYSTTKIIPIVSPEKFGSMPLQASLATMATVTADFEFITNSGGAETWSLLAFKTIPTIIPEEFHAIWYHTTMIMALAVAEGNITEYGKTTTDALGALWDSYAKNYELPGDEFPLPEPTYSSSVVATLAKRVTTHIQRRGGKIIDDNMALAAVKDAFATVWNLADFSFREATAALDIVAGTDEYSVSGSFAGIHPQVNFLWPNQKTGNQIPFVRGEDEWAARQQSDLDVTDTPAVARIAWDATATVYKLFIRPTPTASATYGYTYIRDVPTLSTDFPLPYDDYYELIYHKALVNLALAVGLEEKEINLLMALWVGVRRQALVKDKPRPSHRPEDLNEDIDQLTGIG